jgi:hypothetical protein
MQFSMRAVLIAATLVVTPLNFPSLALAQETRAEAIEQRQAEKASTVHPDEPTGAERIFLAVKRELIDMPSGLYPAVGSVYGGGGFAAGAGYRDFYGDRAFWDIRGLWSIRNYGLAEVSTSSPGHLDGRLDLSAQFSWMDVKQVAYYGLGMNSAVSDRTNFGFQQIRAGAGAKARLSSVVVIGGGISHEDYNVKRGRGRPPSIEERHTATTAPGLGADPSFLHTTGSAGVDWRPAAGYARRGGLYEVRYHNYHGNQTGSFERLDAELVQHVPLLRENWVISMRGLANTTLSGDIPYFLLPSLGSGSTLRGYSAWRFRERHSLLLQGEFRWIPNRTGLDMALFFDAGKVANRRRDLDFTGLKKDVGLEVRFHSPMSTPLRFGIARGSEGWRLIVAGGAAF